MSSAVITTVVRIIESLPEATQQQVVDHLREYLEDIQDEIHWDAAFENTQPQLMAAARRAKQEIAAGQAKPLDLDQL